MFKYFKKISALNLSVFLLTLLTSIFSFALESSSQDFETALVLPWKFIEQALNPKTGETSQFQYTMSNLQFEAQGVPFTVPQAQLNVMMHLKPVVSQQNQTFWDTDVLTLQVDVAGFTVQKDIEQDIGGVKAIVHLRADCSNFSLLQAKAQAQMVWDWTVVDRRVSAQLSSLNMAWDPGTWQVSNLTCAGPQGFADVVQAELQTQLATATAFIPTIKSALQDLLNQRMTTWLDQWKEPQWLQTDKSMSLQLFGTGVVSSNGLLFRAAFRMGDLSAPLDMNNLKLLNLADDILQKTSVEQPTVIFSTTALQNLIKQRSIWPQYSMNLNTVSGFTRLLTSRFLQFFVWPDLWNYPKTSTFTLTSNLAGNPSMQFDKSSRVYVQAPITSWVHSRRDDKSWNYIQLSTQLKSWMNYSVSKGNLSVQPVSPVLKTTAKFGDDYVKKYHPNSALSISLMEKAIEESQNLQVTNVAIPQFQLSDTLKMRADSLTRPSADFFFMQWSAVP